MEKKGKKLYHYHQLADATAVYFVSLTTAILIVMLKGTSRFISSNASAVVAFCFILIPSIAMRIRQESPSSIGLSLKNLGGELVVVALLSVVVFPLYAIGYKFYWKVSGSFHLRLPVSAADLILTHFLIVAFPEEFLFRGYIQKKLGFFFTARIKLMGFKIGWHIPVASALFALGHFATSGNPQRLATFLPSILFGILKERRQSLTGCILFHALCNIFSNIIYWGYM